MKITLRLGSLGNRMDIIKLNGKKNEVVGLRWDKGVLLGKEKQSDSVTVNWRCWNITEEICTAQSGHWNQTKSREGSDR